MNVGLDTRLKAGAEAEYDALHDVVWPEALDAIRASGVTTWRIYRGRDRPLPLHRVRGQ